MMGDFNSRLARSYIHTKTDSDGYRLYWKSCGSSHCVVSARIYQPKRRHSNASFMNIHPEKTPSQIDYIIVSSRWSTGARNCRTSWGLPIAVHGRKYDHALLSMTFKLRLKCDQRRTRRNFSALKVDEISEAHNKAIDEELQKTSRPLNASDQLKRLNTAMKAAQSTLPKQKNNPK